MRPTHISTFVTNSNSVLSLLPFLLKQTMSFGGPGGLQKTSKPIPPERGSFPLE